MKQLSRREFVALTVATGVAGRVASPFAGALYPSAVITVNDVIERIKKNVGVEWKAETVDTIKSGDPSTPVTGIVTTSMATLDVLQQAVKAGANLIITSAPTFYSRADNRTPNAGRGFGAGAAGAAGAGRGQPPPRGAGAGPGAGGPSPATVFGPGTGASAAMPPTPPLPPSIVPPTQPGAGLGAAASATPPPPDPVYAGKNAFIDKNKLVIFRLNEHWNMRKPDPRAQGLAAAMGWTN
jgi:hypothetical protein